MTTKISFNVVDSKTKVNLASFETEYEAKNYILGLTRPEFWEESEEYKIEQIVTTSLIVDLVQLKPQEKPTFEEMVEDTINNTIGMTNICLPHYRENMFPNAEIRKDNYEKLMEAVHEHLDVCHICGEYQEKEQISYDDGDAVCDSCWQEQVECPNCGNRYSESDLCYSDYYGDMVCDMCIRDGD